MIYLTCGRRVRAAHRSFRQLLALCVLALLASSCATRKLWDATPTGNYATVSQDTISEAKLQKRGVRYLKDDRLGFYYVERSDLRRLANLTIRALATPATVMVDATVVVLTAAATADYRFSVCSTCECPAIVVNPAATAAATAHVAGILIEKVIEAHPSSTSTR